MNIWTRPTVSEEEILLFRLLPDLNGKTRRKSCGHFRQREYRVCRIACTLEQKEQIRERLERDYGRRFHMHYAVLGLPFLVKGKKFYLKKSVHLFLLHGESAGGVRAADQ